MSKMKLKECCNFQEGYVNPSQTIRSYFNGPIKWLRASDLNDSNVFNTEKSLSIKGFESAGKSAFLFKPNTIAISKSGTIGRLGILKDEMCGNRAVINIDVNETIADLYYIFYLLRYKKKEIVRKAEGSIQKNLYVSALETIALNHNDKTTQQKIASVLSALDSKIELNNRINTELEAMAKTLYDYWFVQFDFPYDFAQGKPDKNGKPYKSSGGKMVWSEELKREVPEGWEVAQLGEMIELFDSKRIPLSSQEREKKKGIIPYYGATGVMDYVDEFIFDGEYILLAEDGSVMDEKGFPIVQFIWGKCWVNNHAHVIRAVTPEYNEFYFQLMKRIPVINIKTGSIQMKINQDNLKGYRILVPPSKLIDRYSIFAKSIREKLMNIAAENKQLTELRDWLLPMLMNGQVKVN